MILVEPSSKKLGFRCSTVSEHFKPLGPWREASTSF
jgi:hypothetical protein